MLHVPTARVTAPSTIEISKNRELSWLSERIQRARSKPFSEFTTITPVIAKHILELNPDNRRIKARNVNKIAADIAADRWDINGETIIIAKDGHLNDGQHRLLAVVKANKPIETIVVFGVDRDSRFTVDMGSARTVGDFIGMEGGKHQDIAAGVAQLHLMVRKGLYTTGGGNSDLCTKAAVRAEYWSYEKAIGAAIEETVSTRIAAKVGRIPVAAAHVLLHRANKEAAAFFFAKLVYGDGLKQNDALLALRERLLAVSGKRMKSAEKLEMILRHWNAWRKKQPMKLYRQTSSFPKIER